MDMFLFAVYDRVAGVYSEPFAAVNNAVAVRRFNYLMDNSKMVSADCELYAVGSYNTLTGVYTVPDKPEFIVKAGALNG